MKLSLSVRIAEDATKTRLNVPFEEIVALAAELDYDAVCLRASAGGVQTPREELARMRERVEEAGLAVSMVTADYDVPLNNDRGPNSLRDIDPSLDVAEALGCDLIRVCLKSEEDIEHARRAADRAARRNIRLAHQCHTTTLFEQVGRSLEVLEAIGHPNFGLIYEPANLMLCGEDYGAETLQKFRPYLMNVYVQNHTLDPEGPIELPTWCLGPRRFRHLPIWEQGGVDFDRFFEGLQAIGYDGYFTVHAAQGVTTLDEARDFARRCAEWFRSFA